MRELFETLLLIGTPLLVVLFWHSSMQARERAVTVCRRTCENYGAQLLDQTVSLHRIGFSRSASGRLQFDRSYHFDYSYDGIDRLQGEVIMHGIHAELITLSPRPEPVESAEKSKQDIVS